MSWENDRKQRIDMDFLDISIPILLIIVLIEFNIYIS